MLLKHACSKISNRMMDELSKLAQYTTSQAADKVDVPPKLQELGRGLAATAKDVIIPEAANVDVSPKWQELGRGLAATAKDKITQEAARVDVPPKWQEVGRGVVATAKDMITQEAADDNVPPKWQKLGRGVAATKQTPWINKSMSALPTSSEEDEPDMPPKWPSVGHLKEEKKRRPAVPLKPNHWNRIIPKVTSNTSEYAITKAAAVISENEIGRLSDLGLGRGLDATDSTPWLNKSSFQVRPVTMVSIIGTEEGGSLQSYEREITSICHHQNELKASVTVPQAPVSIGIDAELSRSASVTRKSVGKKILNRTISFRADFHDVPSTSSTDPIAARHPSSLPRSRSKSNTNRTFEERLCEWMLERIRYREEVKQLEQAAEDEPLTDSLCYSFQGNPMQSLADFIHGCSHEDRELIVQDCVDFVYHFRITHYVSAVELGAAEYRVLSESEYTSRVEAGGSFGVEALANAAVSLTTKSHWKKTKKVSDLRNIGIIKPDGTVARGSYGEAVVGIRIQPISNLVTLRYLQLALQQALSNYVESERSSSVGPFLISCSSGKLFLTVNVNNGYSVEGTDKIRHASEFYIFPTEEGKHPYEFKIAHMNGGSSKLRRTSTLLSSHERTKSSEVPSFLNVPTNIIGRNSRPLRMQYAVRAVDSRLALRSRIKSTARSVSTVPWVTGKDIFYIQCARRSYKRASFLALRQQTRREGNASYRLTAVPSVDDHNERTTFMLFKLMSPGVRQEVSSAEVHRAVHAPEAIPGFDELNTQ